MIGTNLLHYEITAKLGEGGMGEVYRARDGRLGRDVAIKVLPELFLADEERLARFEREAQLLASLNHPNIGAIYGLEQEGAKRFLVLELIDGETLQELIKRGMSLEDALEMSAQVATALEAAHEQGIVHRDLKPANVIVTSGGTVKVLDFGLAKAWAPDSGNPQISASPTLTAQMTQAGMILGTAAYMSPEQARGQEVDKRADIWSFGVLTYEMLSGSGLFGGETVTDTLAAVVRAEPDWEDLPRRTPRRVRETLKRCLEKDPNKRLRDIGEARIVLEAAEPENAESLAPATVIVPSRFAWAPWAVASVGLLLAALAMTGIFPRRAAVPREVVTLRAEIAPGEAQLVGDGSNVAFSPDGQSVAYVASDGDGPALFTRHLSSLEARRFAGTSDAELPTFSPDGGWIAYFGSDGLKKVSVRGGAPLTLVEGTPRPRGASWGDDGYVYYAPSTGTGIWRVLAEGGEPEELTTLSETDPTERSHRWPQALPGGELVLLTVQEIAGDFDEANIEVLDLATRERTIVQRGGMMGRYLASGHLIFVREGTVYAAPFDLASGQISRQPAPVLEGVRYRRNLGDANVAVSATGTLLHVSGDGVSEAPLQLMRVTAEGSQEPLSAKPLPYRNPKFSPDGRTLAFHMNSEGATPGVWTLDLERDVASRLTFSELADFTPLWSTDGASIVFSSNRAGTATLWRKGSDGTSEAEQLTDAGNFQVAGGWLAAGRIMLFTEYVSVTGSRDLMLLDLETREVKAYLQTEFNEWGGVPSPDGRWVAYSSNESGQNEIYVRPFPLAAGKWQITSGGADEPQWSPDGSRLYYWGADAHIYQVDVTVDGSSFRAGSPRVLLAAPLGLTESQDWQVAPDGSFLFMTGEEAESEVEPLPHLVFNWFEELKRLVPLEN